MSCALKSFMLFRRIILLGWLTDRSTCLEDEVLRQC